MDGKEISVSSLFISDDKPDCLYPMCFGVSCALLAPRLLSGPDMDHVQWSEIRNRMLQSSAHLLGLLVWRVLKEEADDCRSELQCKLKKAEAEVTALKRIRSEDAKANEKVVSIFAAQEQSWLSERKKLQLQIRALLNELNVLDTKKEKVISNLNERVEEKELLIQSRDKALEEEESTRKELEEKLQKAEAIREELRETAKREAQEHSSVLLKHKTALIELASNHQQLEAEMGCTIRQLEAAKQEVDSVFKQNEESISMVQNLSLEMIKMHKDLEQKDKILSAMLRKSKSHTTEKQMLLKESKISKARRKQAELETERWRALCQCRHNRHLLRSNSVDDADSISNVFLGSKGAHLVKGGCSENRRIGLQAFDNKVNLKTVLLEYLEAEHANVGEGFMPQRIVTATSDSSHQYSPEANGELMIKTDAKHLEGWILSETEKCTMVLEQRHHLEIDAFAEQMRLKDKKLEACRWRSLSLELEMRRLQSHIEALNQNMSELREGNLKLEALLLGREAELKSLKERFSILLQPLLHQRTILNSSPKNLALDHETIWSEVTKSKPREREESYSIVVRNPQHVETENEEENLFDQSKDLGFRVQTPKEVIKKDSYPWKMDLHALGVSFKIKMLKQHLVMLEKMAGTQESCEQRGSDDQGQAQIKGFLSLMTLLNKQVNRYQSLQDKIDDQCKRMEKNKLHWSCEDISIARTREETKTLEHFLEETFLLQRYMVATGQKLMGIKSQIASCFVRGAEKLDGSAGFDLRRLADGVKTLFGEVQRSLQVQIARIIIGDLEGTLACEGIMHLRR